MFEKNLKIAYLIDFYGDALDTHTLNALRSYYNDDLSLAEIATEVGISRQGIRHLIKKGEEQLLFFEDKFGLAQRYQELVQVCDILTNIKEDLLGNNDGINVSEIDRAIGILMKGNQDVRESY